MLQTSSSSPLPPNNNINSSNQILQERFLASIKSDVTRSGVTSYIHKYMRYWHLYEKKGEEGHGDDDDDVDYRYDWLIDNDIRTIGGGNGSQCRGSFCRHNISK